MRLTTWNVNGIRNPFSYQPWNTARTFPAMFDILGSDIIVMQELKIQRKDLRDDMVLLDGWDCYFSLPKHKKGYSGVGIYTRNATCAPIRAEEGLLGVLPSTSGVAYRDLPAEDSVGGYPSEKQIAEIGVDPMALDAEGRCVVLEFPAFVLFGVYSPANSNGLRDDFRYGFICTLDCRIRNLVQQGKNVVLVGDLNVSRSEVDTASGMDDIRKAGITREEYISTPNRRIFNQLLIGGEVVGDRDEGREAGILWDTTRAFHPDRRGMYTHWEQKINARPGNFGSRIDFVLVAEAMQSWVKDANIQEGLLGSDHCPVFADFADSISIDGRSVDLLDIMSPGGTFVRGKRKKEWKITAAPSFSAKRMPEFDKRRTIKAMFTAPSMKRLQTSQAEEAEGQQSLEESNNAHTAATINTSSTNNSPVKESEKSLPSTSPSPLKRKISMPTKEKSSKRQKSDGAASAPKGQQSLKGFFQVKPVPNESSSADQASHITSLKDVQSPSKERNGDRFGSEAGSTGTSSPERRYTPVRSRKSVENFNEDGSPYSSKSYHYIDNHSSLALQSVTGVSNMKSPSSRPAQSDSTEQLETIKQVTNNSFCDSGSPKKFDHDCHQTRIRDTPSQLGPGHKDNSNDIEARPEQNEQVDLEGSSKQNLQHHASNYTFQHQAKKKGVDRTVDSRNTENGDAASSQLDDDTSTSDWYAKGRDHSLASEYGNHNNTQTSIHSAADVSTADGLLPENSQSPTMTQKNDDDPVTDLTARLQTSSKWSQLFTRPVAPLCEGHNEPCKTLQTKKKGSNQGRSFWMCARPLGPSGQKEKNTEWRCGTFIWSSDWKGGNGAAGGG